MSLLPGVEFITVDKRCRPRTRCGAAPRSCAARPFDLLLHLQVSLRASLLARQIPRA